MAKQITFVYNETPYTLEYTRRTVRQMESEGFRPADLDGAPMTVVPKLFAGAFKAHHPFIKQNLVDEIFAEMPDKFKLLETLAEMYNEPIEAMMADPAKGNVTWTVEN